MEQIGKRVFSKAASQGDASRGRDSVSLTAELRVAGATQSTQVRIRNLSAGGLMAELPKPLAPECAVDVALDGIGWVAGRVAWQTEGRAGIAFNADIDLRHVHTPDDAAPAPKPFGRPPR